MSGDTKRKILASRTERRIIDVLDFVCQDIPFEIPASETRLDRLKITLKNVCESFVGFHEDALIRALYGRIDPSFETSFCSNVNVCPSMIARAQEEL